ncbi:MAG: DUF445 family protein [Chitinophagaceae bacterium]|jgi:uncharacterized membrane protein YheB (UPF0754 family)|nr:DUF445 family protein [Chitinophagaceae bacterium]
MNPTYILIPLISAFIGYFTNWIAIKMLFHPRTPWRFPGFTIQGIFPKRQQQFAEKLGKLVSNELLSFGEIEQKITSVENLKKIMPVVDAHVDDFLRHRLSDTFPVLSMFIGEKTINQLKGFFMAELESLFPTLMKNYMKNLQSQLDLEKIVTEKVAGFSSDKLEDILKAIMAREFRFVEILGGVLGFLIGILQVLMTILLG